MNSELESIYDNIKNCLDDQRANFKKWLSSQNPQFLDDLKAKLDILKLSVDFTTGKLSYNSDFVPVHINYSLCYIRHGKTDGNTEPRVYQGQVDYPNNALVDIGVQQADSAADLLLASPFHPPHLVILSPLARASDTGMAYVNKLAPDVRSHVAVESWPDSVEMAFGDWDNMEVRHMPPNHICHLFYLDQNAIVKADKPHVLPSGREIPSETFVDVLIRMKDVLESINHHTLVERTVSSGSEKTRVAMYGHSMVGAAVLILLGQGKSENGFLGFDGSFIMPNATPTFLEESKPHF